MTLTVGSLFSGIGGLELGLERAGMEVKWQVEIDGFCNKVLEKHWPNVTRYQDVREVGRHNLEPVDLICGGFPCQPHSLAGKRKGKEDERNLWPEYLRIVDELRPTWVLGENVPGIRTTILDDILDDLEALDYATRTFDIPACAVGAPHLRHRFFIVAYCNSRDAPECGGAEMADAESKYGEWPKPGGDRRWQPEGAAGNGGCDKRNAADADCEPLGRPTEPRRECGQWGVEPNVGRVANGVPSGVDRLRCLGNAVVPQVAEYIGRMIVAAHQEE